MLVFISQHSWHRMAFLPTHLTSSSFTTVRNEMPRMMPMAVQTDFFLVFFGLFSTFAAL
jgi:hypothetical protein